MFTDRKNDILRCKTEIPDHDMFLYFFEFYLFNYIINTGNLRFQYIRNINF